MKFYLTDLHERHELTLRYWHTDRIAWSCDVFDDFNEDLPRRFAREDGGDALLITSDAYNDLVNFWLGEVRLYNEGKDGDVLGGRYYANDDGTAHDCGEAALFDKEV